jgi:hypothetical protein
LYANTLSVEISSRYFAIKPDLSGSSLANASPIFIVYPAASLPAVPAYISYCIYIISTGKYCPAGYGVVKNYKYSKTKIAMSILHIRLCPSS